MYFATDPVICFHVVLASVLRLVAIHLDSFLPQWGSFHFLFNSFAQVQTLCVVSSVKAFFTTKMHYTAQKWLLFFLGFFDSV